MKRIEWFPEWWQRHCSIFPSTSFGETEEGIITLADSIEAAFFDSEVTRSEADAATTHVQRHPPEYLVADKHCAVLLRAIEVARADRVKARPRCLLCGTPAAEGRSLCLACIALDESDKCRRCAQPAAAGKALCERCLEANWAWKQPRPIAAGGAR